MTTALHPRSPVADGTPDGHAAAGPTARARAAARRLVRGLDADPAFARPALLVLLGATAVLYLWGLGASGWANSFYSAAAQAGSQSGKALFFASSDAGSSITVDKTPASIWVMGLSVRLFGLSSWSILAPQALMGVATVGFTHASVRRWFGHVPALVAGLVVATTPVATLMFRFNNPDALLVLTLTVAAWAITRAIEDGRTRWVVACFALVGVGFMAKMMQAFLVVPPLGVAYLLAGPPRVARRIGQLAWGAVALVVSSGWWVAVVELWPASSRPYIGGSQSNSVLDLLFGYNGFGRLTGNETGSVGGGGGNAGPSWGPTGITRLFNDAFGAQASWLLPAALLVLGLGLAATWRAGRTDRTRAALVVWGGWLVVTALTFSLGEGIIHEYYTVALAPPIGALVGIGVARWWPRRARPGARAALAAMVAVSAWWSATLLGRTPDWAPALRPLVLVGGLVTALLLLLVRPEGSRAGRRAGVAVGTAALLVALAGPTAYSLQTAATPHTGSIPTAGPSDGTGGGPTGGGPGGGGGGPRAGLRPTLGGTGRPGGAPGATGGLLDAGTVSAEVGDLLTADADGFTWVAAAVGSNRAAGYQLATGEAVMAIGGFNGSDPSPTLEQFQRWVAEGRIHYLVEGSGFGAGQGQGATSTATEITTWVEQTFTAVTVDGTTLYDLTQPAAG